MISLDDCSESDHDGAKQGSIRTNYCVGQRLVSKLINSRSIENFHHLQTSFAR